MPGTSFFRDFPKIQYMFGDAELPVNFQNLSVYIDAFDQVREYKAYYQKYTIKNNERPDQLSLDLYGTVDYYWTFFLMNEHLRTSGWPLPSSQVYAKSQEYYPNIVYTTDGTSLINSTGTLLPLCRSETFAVGQWVYLPVSKKAVKILRINDQLAQIFLETTTLPDNESLLQTISAKDAESVLEDSSYIPTVIATAFVQDSYYQHDAIHHYEDANGDWITPETASYEPYPFQWNTVNTAQSISYYQRMRDINLENRAISVLKPAAAMEVVSDFKQLLKQRR